MTEHQIDWSYAAWVVVSDPPGEPHLVVLGRLPHACTSVALHALPPALDGDYWPYRIVATWDASPHRAETDWKIEKSLADLRPSTGYKGIALTGPKPEEHTQTIAITYPDG